MSVLPTAQRLEPRAAALPASTRPDSTRALERVLFALAWLGVVIVPICRGIVPALFGLRTGLGGVIQASEIVSAWLTQTLVWLGLFALCSLLSLSLRTTRLGIFQRLVTLPVAGIAAVLVTLAATTKLDLRVHLSLVWSVSAVLLAGGGRAIRHPKTRAPGLVLLALGLAAALEAVARWMTLDLENALSLRFTGARVLTTISFVLELAGVALAAATTLRGGRRDHALLALGVVFALGLVWAGAHGQTPRAPVVQTWVSSTLRELSRNSAAWVPDALNQALVAFAHLFALVVLLRKFELGWVGPVLSLCVLARGSSDIPALALLSITAGLAALFLVTAQVPDGSGEP
jgi:hypothetical protein